MKAEEILQKYTAGERNFSAVSLNESNLSGINLSKANLDAADLSVANLSGANLSETNLSKAKLNVARLSGANLSKAILREAILNVANLTLADLSGADLTQASLVRAELTRADLSGANMTWANLNGADLKDAKLRNANLTHANLSQADLKWTTFTAANLSQANLHSADLSGSDCSGADLSQAELRQANLSRTNLNGTNLSGANLRWADLSGADLSWADLSGARLSGANLTGANLTGANLLGTTLVHADLTRTNLIGVDWAGADLSGAVLTGVKLYDVLRFGIKAEELVCEWVDLSPNGDQSAIYHLTPENSKSFFLEKPPTVCIEIDEALNQDAHYALAVAYRQIAQHYQLSFTPPNIQIGRHRTTLRFELVHDAHLFTTAGAAILPFKDAVDTHRGTIALIELLQCMDAQSKFGDSDKLKQIQTALNQSLHKIKAFKLSDASLHTLSKLNLFQAPTKTTLINAHDCSVTIYRHPMFGKRMASRDPALSTVTLLQQNPIKLPAIDTLVEFLQGL